jgi:molecular chaperone GrpE
MTRHRPDEGAVRDAMKAEESEVAEAASGDSVKADGGVREDGATDEGVGAQPEPKEPKPEAEDELTVARRERDEYLDLAKRAQADFENYRKRAAKDVASAGARARAELIREMLPVLDNLERALDNAPDDDPMAEGVKLVLMDMQGVLSRAGVETIEPKGEQFDPNMHDALTTRQEEGVDAGVVLDVVEKGYKGADQVIRPARVIVAA